MQMHLQTLAFLQGVGSEMFLIAVVALLLFGKDFPAVSRKAARIIGQWKRKFAETSAEFTREINDAAQASEGVKQDLKLNLRPPDTAIPRQAFSANQPVPTLAPAQELKPLPAPQPPGTAPVAPSAPAQSAQTAQTAEPIPANPYAEEKPAEKSAPAIADAPDLGSEAKSVK